MNLQHKKSFDDVAEEIQDICFELLRSSPFYGHIMGSINRELIDSEELLEPTEIRSLGLSTIKLTINYKLWEPLTFSEKVNRLNHEVIHFIFLHPWIDKPKNIGLFYAACDISANMYNNDQNSLRKEFFDQLLARHGMTIDASDGWFSIYNSLVDLFIKVPSNILKKHKGDQAAFEAEMAIHQSNAAKGEFFDKGTKDLNEAIVMLPNTSTGHANLGGLLSMINSLKAGGASEEDIKNMIQAFIDKNEDPWKYVSDDTSSTAAEALVKRLLSDSKSRGDVPGGLSDYVDLMLSPPLIDWRKELRNFTKRAGHVEAGSTMTRRSKKYKTFPALKIRRLQRVALAIDTSGSMSDEEFNQGISEVRGALASNCQVIVIQADCVVDNVEIYNKKMPNLSRITRYGNGGTSFDDPLLYVKTGGKLDKHSEFPKVGPVDGMVYITDGYAPAPRLENYPRCKVLWLSTQRTVSDLESDGFLGKILKLDLKT